MRARNLVLFDFDGVIADSYRHIHAALEEICPVITEEEHRRGFESNIYEWYSGWMKSHTHERCRHDLDVNSLYGPKLDSEVEAFEGVAEILPLLAGDHTLIIVSSTSSEPIRNFLGRYSMAGHFSEIMGKDVHVSKVEKIAMIFSKYQTDADHLVFVTDTLGDMREAREHSVSTIGCSWGYHARETLERGQPFRVVDHPSQLPRAVADYFARETRQPIRERPPVLPC